MDEIYLSLVPGNNSAAEPSGCKELRHCRNVNVDSILGLVAALRGRNDEALVIVFDPSNPSIRFWGFKD